MTKIKFGYQAIEDLNEIKTYYEGLDEYSIIAKTSGHTYKDLSITGLAYVRWVIGKSY